jgi:hypothetical protein
MADDKIADLRAENNPKICLNFATITSIAPSF